jgi:hypothetical protein
MSNANEPAFPTIYADMSQNGQREIYCDNTGLTKRERFAMSAPDAPVRNITAQLRELGIKYEITGL